MTKMDPQNRAALLLLLERLKVTEAMLRDVSECAYGDMEGADGEDFFVSDELYGGLASASECVARTIRRCKQIIGEPL
jgi:hypothetical protein